MTAKHWAVLGLGLACFGGLGSLWRSHSNARDIREALTVMGTQERVATGEWQRDAERLAAATKQEAEARARLAKQSAAKPAGTSESPPVRRPPSPTRQDLIAADPRLQALSLRAERAQMVERYGQFFHALRLTPTEIETFIEIAVKRSEQAMDLANIRKTAPATDRAAIAALQKKAEEEQRAAQRELLGDAGFEELLRFERTAEPRNLVSQVAGMAVINGTPLTREQADRLVRTMADLNERFQSGKNILLSEGVDWDTVDGTAAKILSPDQLALFKAADARWWAEFESAFDVARKKSGATEPLKSPGG